MSKKQILSLLTMSSSLLAVAGNASAFELTFENKVAPAEFQKVCEESIDWINDPKVVCEGFIESLDEAYRDTEGAFYNVFSSLNANTEHYESNCRKQTNCFNSIRDGYIFSAPEGYRLDMTELNNLSVTYSIIGVGFTKYEGGYDPRKYGKDVSIQIVPEIRHTIRQNGTVLVDTVKVTTISLAAYVDCSVAKKPHKCIKRNDDYRWPSGRALSNWNFKETNGQDLATSLIGRENSLLFDHACKAWKSSYSDKPKPTCPISQTRGARNGNRTDIDYISPKYSLPGGNEFDRVEGGRANLNLSGIELFKETARAAALAARESDPRYAGDVSRCIVEARSSMAQDRAAGSLLGNIASIAGAGDLGSALHTMNNASSSYDSLTGKEKDLVDSCMARKGY